MKKIFLLLAIGFGLSAPSTSAQCVSTIVQANPTVQNGSVIFQPAGVNQYDNAVIWLKHCLVERNGEMAYNWIQESPVGLPYACTGWIYGWQVDLLQLESYVSVKCQGFMTDNQIVYHSGVKTFMPKRRWIQNSPSVNRASSKSLQEMGINPTKIVNPDIFKDEDGNINLDNVRFGNEGDDEIVEIDPSPLTDLMFGSTGKGFSLQNPESLQLKITVYDSMGRLIEPVENVSSSLVWENTSLAAGTYIVHIQHGKETRREPVIIL